MIKNKRIFITGGVGFIGSRLVKELCSENQIWIYDNFSRNALQYTNLIENKNVKVIEGDILNESLLEKTVCEFKPNIVLHLAAIAGITTVTLKPVYTMKVNMIGSYNLFEALLKVQDELYQIIDFSTSEIFGSYAYKLGEEAGSRIASVGEARWTYSTSKLAAEHLAHAYFTQYNLPITTVRPFNIYGPGQVGEGAIHQFVIRALNNEEMQIHGDGDQIRSWCYVDDFIDCIKLILDNPKSIGEAFNIGNPRGTITIAMLAYMIKNISQSLSEIVYVPKNYTDVELRVPSIEKAKKMLGYTPKVNLEEGLANTIKWYKNTMK